MKPIDLDIDKYHETIKAFHSESDRAAAVLAGSFLEHFLAKYLRSFMVADKAVLQLFDGFGPFAQFTQRFEAAYAFGWLSASQRNDIKIIIKIRNRFAHHPLETSFDKSPVSGWCADLSTKGIQAPIAEVHHTNRQLYLISISLCIGSWHNTMLKRGSSKRSVGTS